MSSVRDFTLPRAYEMAGMVRTLRRIAPLAEKAGVTLCIETINTQRGPDRKRGQRSW